MKAKLTDEQVLHLIDLLEINIKEKQTCPHRLMTKEMIDEAIAFGMALIEVLESEVNKCLKPALKAS